MEFRLLGPLQVHEDTRALALGGPKQRALLAVLLLNANDVVPTDRLIDEVWGPTPPATVAKSVQVYVSRLRKAMDDGRLVTRDPGYLLRVERSELDLTRFEDLVHAAGGAPADRAAALLRDALALWRGPPLADLADEPFARAAVARLEDLRLAAIEARIAADLETGRHSELAGELESLVAAYPLREDLRGQLMLALYRSGRQAEALAAYAAARATLVDELGIEPGPRLRALHQAILAQDAALDPPAPMVPAATMTAAGAGPVAAEAGGGGFVGRERELALCTDALAATLAGHGRIVLVAGEPGIGKSRLAEEIVAQARARGARPLVGRCWEAGGAPAYWPWIQALRGCVADATTLPAGALGPGAGELAQILPELRAELPGLPAPIDGDGGRFRLFEAASALLAGAADRRPLVVVLDDLHAADEPSLLLLRFIARTISSAPVLLVCAFRDVDPTLRDPLASTLAQLVREPGSARIELTGWTAGDVAAFIAATTGTTPEDRVVAAIHTDTEGNPLFVAEVVRLLAAEDRLGGADAHLRIPPGVRAVIGERLGRLSAACRDLLVLASVLGREFRLDALIRLAGDPRDRVLDVLDEALAERVVADVPGSASRLRFAHALIRDALYDELTAARRSRLHERAGEALEAIYAADPEPHLAELAQHFAAAAPAGGAERAVAYARRAAARATAQLAHEEAVRHHEIALEFVTDPDVRCDVLLELGDARARAGDTAAAKEAFLAAVDLAERRDLPDRLGRAALGYGGRLSWEVSRDDERLVPLLERAIAAAGPQDSILRVRLLARLAGGPLRDARFAPQRRAALSREALEMARRIGDPTTLAYAIQGYILGHHSPAHTPRQLELAAELIDVATDAGEPERIIEGLEEHADSCIELGDVPGARADLAAMERIARELRQPAQDWLVAVYHALVALLEGRFADAEGLVAHARALGEDAQSWNAEVTYRLQLYVLRRAQDRLAEIEALVRRSADDYPTYPVWRCVLAHVAAATGRADEARAMLDRLADDDFAFMPFDEEWLVGMGLLAETAGATGAAGHAATLYRLLAPYEDRIAVSYPEIATGAVARSLGLLATTLGRWEAAERHFAVALETNERAGARPWTALGEEDRGRMLLARGAPGDGEAGGAALARAVAAYEDLGMTGHAARARAVTSVP